MRPPLLMRRFSSSLPSWLDLVPGFIATGLAALFLGGVGTGFDFTDEGFYYLSFAHPENVSDNQTSFYFFGSKLFALLGYNLVAMRLATLAAILGGTLLFLRGTSRFAAAFGPTFAAETRWRRLTLGAAMAVSFLGFAISPPALSYNFQNAFCLLAASGCLLDACARPRSARRFDPAVLLPLAGFGLLTGLEFFVKFSSSVPLAVGGFALFLLIGRASPTQKLAATGALLACVAAAALAYFGFFQDFSRWWFGVKGTFGAIWDGGYATGEIRRYATEMVGTGQSLLADALPVWLLAAVAAAALPALRARPRWQSLVAGLVGGAIFGVLTWLAVDKYLFADNWGITPFYLVVLVLFGVLTLGSRLARPHSARIFPGHPWALAAAAVFLFSLPYFGAFGTNNPIHLNCLYQIAPWIVLAAALLAAVDAAWGSAWPSRGGLLLVAFVSAGQFYEGYWNRPYRTGGPRPSLIAPTPVGFPPTTLRLAEEANDFLVTGRRALQEHGFQFGDDLLVFFNLPGFVFAAGGASPGHPWYFQGSRHSYELNLMRLNFIPADRRQRAFIVRNSVDTDWADFQPYLRRAGLNFPEDYTLISPPMTSPLTRVPFEIWMPKVRLSSAALRSPDK